jgi:hypothetical protein
MENKFRMPKGRQTIRKNGGRRTRLWELSGSQNSTVQKLEQVYLAGLDAMDRVEARHAKNKADARFTAEGVRDDLLKFALNDAVPALHQGRVTIRKAKDELAERKGKLKLAGPDKTDLVAAMRRQEIRARLLTMKPDERDQYILRYGVDLPAEVAVAIIELPPEYSGVPKSQYDLLTEDALSKQFGEAIAEIKEIEQAIEAAESTIEAGRDEIRQEVGITDPAKFNEMARPIEAKQSAPWLRKGAGGEIRVVDLEKRVERVATPEEIESGVYYKNFEDYSNRKDVA